MLKGCPDLLARLVLVNDASVAAGQVPAGSVASKVPLTMLWAR